MVEALPQLPDVHVAFVVLNPRADVSLTRPGPRSSAWPTACTSLPYVPH